MSLPQISDEQMLEGLASTKDYAAVLLRTTEKRREPGADAIVFEHGRRSFALRAAGVLSIVCPVINATDLAGWLSSTRRPTRPSPSWTPTRASSPGSSPTRSTPSVVSGRFAPVNLTCSPGSNATASWNARPQHQVSTPGPQQHPRSSRNTPSLHGDDVSRRLSEAWRRIDTWPDRETVGDGR